MAIDSAAKRHSALNFSLVGWRTVLPDGAVDAGDRQTLVGSYAGIAAAVLGKVHGFMIVAFRVLKPAVSFAAKKPSVGFVAKKPSIGFEVQE